MSKIECQMSRVFAIIVNVESYCYQCQMSKVTVTSVQCLELN